MPEAGTVDHGARLQFVDQRFRRRDCLSTAALISVMVAIIASSGSWLAVLSMIGPPYLLSMLTRQRIADRVVAGAY